MRFPEHKFEDVNLQKIVRAIASTFKNISVDNMRFVELTGSTNATPDTESKFRHALGMQPSLWLPLEGRVYVPRFGLSEQEIDIRSSVASEPFRIIVIQ